VNEQSFVFTPRPALVRPASLPTNRQAVRSNARNELPGAAARPDKRDLILRAAVRVFAERGFLGAQVADVRFNLANCLAVQGRFDQAVEHFRMFVRARPDDASAREHLNAALLDAAKRRGSRRATMGSR
jgi:tetratricopeptide (TPR) repeat protein